MSFSVDVKREISVILPKKECCELVLSNCYNLENISKFIMGKCCIKTLLRQAFIDFGSVNNPEKSYHLELVVDSEELAALLTAVINEYNISAKIMVRGTSYVVYLKGSEDISDFLKLTGAANTVMEFENVRILKEVRSNINRGVNCETSNIQKKIDASFKQMESIEYIKNTAGLSCLPEELQQLAELRLTNKEAGLMELGELSNPRVSKSGVSHRMKRIIDFAENLKNKKEN